MPQTQQRRSDMWWRGYNDALAGDPPNESYYHYYYDYKLAYHQVRREQQRTHLQRLVLRFGGRAAIIGAALIVLGVLGYGAYAVYGPESLALVAEEPTPTATIRPTPRPTLTPVVTPTPEPPTIRPDALAVVTGVGDAPLRARSKPGTGADATVVARLREGQQVRIVEGPQSADGLDWWRVEADGVSGWAAAPYLQPIESPTPQ